MNIDFKKIRNIDGDQRTGFEEFVCHIARNTKDIPAGSVFKRFRGDGGDGGVECLWQIPNGEEWGWQSKYFFRIDKQQLNKSVTTALKIHPNLRRYYIAIPYDLTGPTARRGKSEFERFEEYRQEWKKQAEDLGRNIEFILIDRSKLIDTLSEIDSSGGRTRFWFEEEKFTHEWFGNQIEDAIESSKPRYTPKLNIKTPTVDVFEAFGTTVGWTHAVKEKIKEIEDKIKHWDNSLHDADWNGKKDFPENAKEKGEGLLKKLVDIKEDISKLFERNGTNKLQIVELQKQVIAAYNEADTCHYLTKEAVENEHGEGKADSVGFKQFMQEYQVSFPTRHYDTAGEIKTMLNELIEWLRGNLPLLSSLSAFLLYGPAGIGKTHSICDIAFDRHQSGLKSIVLLGQQFGSEEPWTQIKRLIGLTDAISRDQLLDMLDIVGESSGFPLIIFIDAINETSARDFWKKHLMSLINQIKRYTWIKLCVSCRSSFIEDTIPKQVDIFKVEHHGFEGVEFDACFEYFAFYGIELPSTPLLQTEYLNPLFLKLVCESLRDNGQSKIPTGILGFNQIVQFLFEAKNNKLAELLDYDKKDRRVEEAMKLLSTKMHEKGTLWLEWNEAKAIIESRWSGSEWSKSIFNNLIKENLLKEDRAYDDTDKLVDVISISFQRLGDHILISKYLFDIPDIKSLEVSFKSNGSLNFTIQDHYSQIQYKNLLEALAIQIPEKFNTELTNVVTNSPIINQVVIDSLEWRAVTSISEKTVIFFRTPIVKGDTKSFFKIFESLLSVSTIDGHLLNANWIHKTLKEIPLLERDGKLSPFLHFTFGEKKNVDRLIRWGLKANLIGISKDTRELWLLILCWFCSSSDRRVRDYSTKAMIRISESQPAAWKRVIQEHSTVDDEYVIERCLASAYGALVRSNDVIASSEISQLVYRIFFESGLFVINALIIDYARLIIEHTKHLGASKTIDLNKCLPPYSGDKTIDWPDEKYIEQFKDSYSDLPKLYRSCLNDDFQHYTVPSVIRKYKKDEVNILDACRWILNHIIVDIGYTKDLEIAKFDRYLLSKYGSGRSRPEWAERVGKKYQWISLYRLAAKLAIRYPGRKSDLEFLSDKQSLLVLSERNIDVTIIEKEFKPLDKQLPFWIPTEYNHPNPKLISDLEWIGTVDFPDDVGMLMPGKNWIVLDSSLSWERRITDSEEYPYRQLWMQLRSFLIKNDDVKKCWEWIQSQNFMNDWMPRGFRDMNYGFWGEYPWATPYDFIYLEETESYFSEEKKIPCKLTPSCNTINIRFSFDAYQENTLGVRLPSDPFFKHSRLTWNTKDGYNDENGNRLFFDPSLSENCPSALLVNNDYMMDYLKKNNQTIIWTVVGEKMILGGSGDSLGYTSYSRAYLLKDDGSVEANKKFVKKVIHKEKK